MNPYQVVFAAPWPKINDKACVKCIVRAPNIERALQIATKYGAVANIGAYDAMPIIDDNREGATSVTA